MAEYMCYTCGLKRSSSECCNCHQCRLDLEATRLHELSGLRMSLIASGSSEKEIEAAEHAWVMGFTKGRMFVAERHHPATGSQE